MKPTFIDSHVHLSSSPLVEEAEALLQRAQEVGVHTVINICTDLDGLEAGERLATHYPKRVYNAAAVHPHDAGKDNTQYFARIKEKALQKKLCAIGETGLDYHYQHSSVESQKSVCIQHLQLALETKLPVIIHCREAFSDLFSILDAHYKSGSTYAPGVLHCFTGTLSEAATVIEKGWYLSLSGVVTFKKSTVLREVAAMVPLDRLLIETDAPFLAPQTKRGKQNEPAYVVETAMVIAGAKGITLSEIAEATTENAQQLFKISPQSH